MTPQMIGAFVLALFVVAAFFVPKLLDLQGSSFYILFGALTVLGAAGYAIFIWFMQKKQESDTAGAQPAEAMGMGGDAEIDQLVREADAKLSASKGARAAGLPAVFLIGDTGSTKTTAVVHCGLEPELLAGQIYQEGSTIVSTRAANIFLAKNALFVDAGGALLADTNRWTRLIKRLAPSKQAPRAAIVCFDAETFVRQGANEAAANAARNLHAKLAVISEQLGISFPVYVLFTRSDRMPFFLDFVRNLSTDEALQVFGMTVPMKPLSSGVYAEEETRRLSELFSQLFYSLADKRTLYMPRENDPEKIPGAYEFPREFRKLRAPMVQFLVDLCRPSQLRASPFLRGFYFCGVRPVIVNDSAPVPVARPQQSAFESAAGATGVFKAGQRPQQQQQMAMPSGGSRKVPQWMFLARLFNDVILGDRDGMAASGASTKTSAARRVLLIAAAALSLIALTGFTVSFFGNRSLVNTAMDAAKGMGVVDPAGAGVANVESLRKLETLRQSLEQLTGYERDGAPWSLRWGLYTGTELYPVIRKLYYQRFDQLLLAQTRMGMLGTLQRLPGTPGPSTDEYGPTYDTLKGYLIITSNHDKSTRPFLSPLLLNRWSAGRNVDAERLQLAQKQFDFYSDDLKIANPFSSQNDAAGVERARDYLSKFSGPQAIYRYMLSEASRLNKPVNFNKQFPGSEEVVVNNRDIAGAFTKGGWATMQNSIKKADQFFAGEKWVLGDRGSTGNIDRAQLEKDLTDLYTKDFIDQWRNYLKVSVVRNYADLADAAKKLNTLSNNQTPLLALFWLASQNTAVESDKVKAAFDSIYKVVPPPATTPQYILPGNSNYISALSGLQVAVEQAAGKKDDPSAIQATLSSANSARQSVKMLANTFLIDQEGRLQQVSQKLLEDPITQVEALVKGAGRDELNSKGAGMCRTFAAVKNKFPFSQKSTLDATLDDVAKVFRPKDGALWVLYESGLKKFVRKEGSQYVAQPDPSGAIVINPAFLRFFNDAVRFSEAVYPGGATEPMLRYTLAPVKSEQIESTTLTIDGQTAKNVSKQFLWPGSGRAEVKLTIKLAGGSSLEAQDFPPNLWSVFRFFADADRTEGNSIEWVMRSGKAGKAMVTYRFIVDPSILSKEFLSGLSCVSQVAK
jgi:type VI secretion system protein ImpL